MKTSWLLRLCHSAIILLILVVIHHTNSCGLCWTSKWSEGPTLRPKHVDLQELLPASRVSDFQKPKQLKLLKWSQNISNVISKFIKFPSFLGQYHQMFGLNKLLACHMDLSSYVFSCCRLGFLSDLILSYPSYPYPVPTAHMYMSVCIHAHSSLMLAMYWLQIEHRSQNGNFPMGTSTKPARGSRDLRCPGSCMRLPRFLEFRYGHQFYNSYVCLQASKVLHHKPHISRHVFTSPYNIRHVFTCMSK